jgi:hypothetical protein
MNLDFTVFGHNFYYDFLFEKKIDTKFSTFQVLELTITF